LSAIVLTSGSQRLAALIALAWICLIPALARGQSPSISVGTFAGLAGATIEVPIAWAPGASPVSSLQFDLTLPSPLSWVSTGAGPAANAAGKEVSSAPLPGGVRVVIFGFNQTLISSGTVAAVRLTVAPGSPAGTLAVGISGITGSTADGSAVPATGSPGAVIVNAGGGNPPPVDPITDPKITLFLPAFSLDSSAIGKSGFRGSGYTGIALANLDSADARLVFTAFDPNGNRISGGSVTNPAQRTLSRGGQLPVVDTQLFGTTAGPVGWMKVDSTVSKISSFFMAFDSNLTVLDGAEASTEAEKTAILPEVGESGFNRIYLVNPGNQPLSVTLNLMKSDGTVRAGVSRQINADGALAADLYPELFPQAAVDPSDYLWITTPGEVVPYELLAGAGRDIRILNGQNTARGLPQLYSPQYVVGGPWRSTISIVNLESRTATVEMHFVPDDTSRAEKTALFEIPANGKLYLSDQRVFLDPAVDLTKTITQGWVEIASDGARLIGSVTFGGAGKGRFASTLPLVGELNRNVIFSHAASNTTYFTGVALVNPGSTSAQVTIDLYGADGMLEATVTTNVPSKGRSSRLLTELFPALVGEDRTSGYIRVTSDWPLASFALFGTNSLSVLSAIPAKPAP